MHCCPPTSFPKKLSRFVFLLLLAGVGAGLTATAQEPAAKPTQGDAPPIARLVPETVEDLKAIQKQVRAVLDKVIPCTVGIRLGQGQGSGVIVSRDGLVLTAGHVSGAPGRDCTVILHDGRTLKGKTLGQNRSIDSGMIKIVDEGPFPFVEMGKNDTVKPGDWCVAIGHPGGFRPGRTPVVRLGRVLANTKTLVATDCTLVGGDSGGPLFDLNGRVIGIHSRIGPSITANIHVPVDTYHETWDRLVKGESWGGGIGTPPAVTVPPFMGVQGDPESKEAKIVDIVPDGPAAKAGLKVNDVVLKFDGQKVGPYSELAALIRKKKPGDVVTLEVQRGSETMSFKVTLGKRES